MSSKQKQKLRRQLGSETIGAGAGLRILRVLALALALAAIVKADTILPGDVNGDNQVTGGDSLLINQALIGLRFIITGIELDSSVTNGFRTIHITYIGNTNRLYGIMIGNPVNVTLSNLVFYAPNRISAIVPDGGNEGTGYVLPMTIPGCAPTSFATFTYIPPPTNVTATAIGSDSIVLYWDNVATNYDGLQIWQRAEGSDVWQLVATLRRYETPLVPTILYPSNRTPITTTIASR